MATDVKTVWMANQRRRSRSPSVVRQEGQRPQAEKLSRAFVQEYGRAPKTTLRDH